MKPNNPFIITSEYLGSAYFCDREFETKVLTDNILNGRNTVLVSDRRMGKSGLIAHAFDQAAVRESFRTFSVDLYATTSLSEMVFLLAKEIIGPLKSQEGAGRVLVRRQVPAARLQAGCGFGTVRLRPGPGRDPPPAGVPEGDLPVSGKQRDALHRGDG